MAQRGTADNAERYVAPELRGQRHQLVMRKFRMPQRRACDERRCSISRAAGHSTRNRNSLTEDNPDSGFPPEPPGKQHCRTDGEIVAVKRDFLRLLSADFKREMLALLDGNLIVERYGVKYGRKIVVTVGPQRADPQIQVDFRRGLDGHRHESRW